MNIKLYKKKSKKILKILKVLKVSKVLIKKDQTFLTPYINHQELKM